jgi:hypothetical protein
MYHFDELDLFILMKFRVTFLRVFLFEKYVNFCITENHNTHYVSVSS